MFELKEPQKTFHPDGTLSYEFIELPDGTEVSITYDKTGTKILERREIPPYTEHISKDGKCISRYRKDGTLSLTRQRDENGDWKITEYDKTGKRPVCSVFEPKSEEERTGENDVRNKKRTGDELLQTGVYECSTKRLLQ